MGGGVEGAAHVLGDALAHRAHRLDGLALLGLRGGSRLRSRGGRRCRWRLLGRGFGRRWSLPGLAGLDVAEDVLLRDAAAAAGALDARDVDVVLGRDPRDDRGDELRLATAVVVLSRWRRGCRGAAAGGSGAASCSGSGSGAGASAAFAAAGPSPSAPEAASAS